MSGNRFPGKQSRADRTRGIVRPNGSGVMCWVDTAGIPHELSEIDLAYLVNIIKLKAEWLEASTGPDRDGHDQDLLLLQAELDSRGPEVEQLQGIHAALLKSLARK